MMKKKTNKTTSQSKTRSVLDELHSGDSNTYTGANQPHPGQGHTVWPTGTPPVPPVPKPVPPAPKPVPPAPKPVPPAPKPVPPVPKPVPPAPKPVPPTGGDVPTSKNSQAKTEVDISSGTYVQRKSVQLSPLAKDSTRITASDLRRHAIDTRTAVVNCNYNVHNLGWQWCNVTLTFENDRKLPYTEAATYATTLYVKAWNAAVNGAIASGNVGPQNMCNLFVLAVGKEMDIPYFKNDPYKGDHSANSIYEFLVNAVQSHNSGWELLDENTVIQSQDCHGDLEGMFVVGAAHSIAASGNEHGHVVLAVPAEFPRIDHPGRIGPWAIDAKRPQQSYRASGLFYTEEPNQLTEPIWVVYRP
jgi:outer membrane biosynthesis protein TonB